MHIVVLAWLVLALFLGLAAKANERSFWVWFLLGIAIDPILACYTRNKQHD